MGPRWHRLAAEISKFLAVGGVATLVSLVLFNFLVHGFSTAYRPLMADHPIAAFVIANLVGMVVSYHGTRSWAFQNREPVHADGGRTAYLAINLATMLIPIACLWFTRHVLNLADPFSDNLSANVIGLGLGTAARFYLYRTWVFRHPEVPGLPATLLQRTAGIRPEDGLADD
jgi:putative flippase GtrA